MILRSKTEILITSLEISIAYNKLLLGLLILPFLSSLIMILIPKNLGEEKIKKFGLGISILIFGLSLVIWYLFDNELTIFQFGWLGTTEFSKDIQLSFRLGIDGISLFFILLTTLLIPLCLLASWETIQVRAREYFIAFLILEGFVLLVFSVLDILGFYICFESVLIPIFLIIGIWGSRERKVRAAYIFFLYTLFGSIFLLLGIIWILTKVGTTDYLFLINYLKLDIQAQRLLWLAFFASFAAKVPILPVHIWLPEAHVEAPTAGSVILAGILLKLGTYGLIRYSLALFPMASLYFAPLVWTFCVVGIIYTSLTAIRQTDLKRIIAYSSVAHINLVVAGTFAFNLQGLEGSIIQQLSHGLVSGALFLVVGVLYDRHHTRLVKYYSGLGVVMPLFVMVFGIFTIANIALPGTSSFVGEFLILAGLFNTNTTLAFLAATGMVLGGCYSLWLYNRVSFGNIKTQYIGGFRDLNFRELLIFSPLIFLTFFIGLYPDIFLVSIHASTEILLEQVKAGI